jgi:hypothetical protein
VHFRVLPRPKGHGPEWPTERDLITMAHAELAQVTTLPVPNWTLEYLQRVPEIPARTSAITPCDPPDLEAM